MDPGGANRCDPFGIGIDVNVLSPHPSFCILPKNHSLLD